MADRAARSGARRIAPQPVQTLPSTAPEVRVDTRRTRKTRSQSNDISDSEVGARRQREARVPAGHQESTGATSPRKGRRQQAGKAAAPPHTAPEPNVGSASGLSTGLPTVLESAGTPEGNQRTDRHVATSAKQSASGVRQEHRSPGGASVLSGTTMRTSRSGQEFEDLDAEDILTALPDLASASDKLLKLLIPDDASKKSTDDLRRQLATKTSREQKNYQRLQNSFNVQRDYFGTAPLIGVEKIVSKLINAESLEETSQATWRPDPILKRANFAIFLAHLLTSSLPHDAEELWRDLDSGFPSNFVGAADIADSGVMQRVITLGLEIRTQFAIAQLLRDAGRPDFDAERTIREIFRLNSGAVRGWDTYLAKPENFGRGIQGAIQKRHSLLSKEWQQAHAASKDNGQAAAALPQHFPLSALSYSAVNWAAAATTDLQGIVEDAGGPEAITESLRDHREKTRARDNTTSNERANFQVRLFEDEEASTPPRIEQPQPFRNRADQLSSGLFNPSSPISKGLAASLMQRKAARQKATNAGPKSTRASLPVAGSTNFARQAPVERDVPQSAPPQARFADHARVDEDWRPLNEEDEDDDEDDEDDEEDSFQVQDITSMRRKVLAVSTQQQAESNKENQYTSPVRPAYRSLVDPQSGARKVTPIADADSSNDGQEIEELSQDQGYQGTRLMASSSTRSGAGMRTNKRPAASTSNAHASPAKRARFENVPQRDRVASSEPRVLQERKVPPTSTHELWQNANEAARLTQISASSGKAQVRRAWSAEETERLVELIEGHGVSYAYLKKLDENGSVYPYPVLGARDQVAIKDKARNMKMDFLKAGTFLPRNFSEIPMSAPLIEKLEGLGIQYNKVLGMREGGQLR